MKKIIFSILCLTTSLLLGRFAEANPVRGAALFTFQIDQLELKIFSPVVDRLLASYDIHVAMYDFNHLTVVNNKQYLDYHAFNLSLKALLERVDIVDIYVLGYDNEAHKYIGLDIPPALLHKIRLVYNSGCKDGEPEKLSKWLSLGVQTVVGHPRGESASPIFASRFFELWLKGFKVSDAVTAANKYVADNGFLAFAGAALFRRIWETDIADRTFAAYAGNGEIRF